MLFKVLFVLALLIFISGKFVVLLLFKDELFAVANAEITDNPVNPLTRITDNIINKLNFVYTFSIIKKFCPSNKNLCWILYLETVIMKFLFRWLF